MSDIEFKGYGKTPRLRREVLITEKIDGTNAAVVIVPIEQVDHIRYESGDIQLFDDDDRKLVALVGQGEDAHAVFAQSRKRFIIPGDDNFGFAAWVQENAEGLVDTLGPGTHFGEWWGSKIQRGYGLTNEERRFSLFDPLRYGYIWTEQPIPGLGVVPVLGKGTFSDELVDDALGELIDNGSHAARTWDGEPEGIIVRHLDSGHIYKVLLDQDHLPKTTAHAA